MINFEAIDIAKENAHLFEHDKFIGWVIELIADGSSKGLSITVGLVEIKASRQKNVIWIERLEISNSCSTCALSPLSLGDGLLV